MTTINLKVESDTGNHLVRLILRLRLSPSVLTISAHKHINFRSLEQFKIVQSGSKLGLPIGLGERSLHNIIIRWASTLRLMSTKGHDVRI